MKAHLIIEGMHCSACERRVENAVLGIFGVKSAKANAEAGTLIIEFDPKHQQGAILIDKQIAAAIEAIDFNLISYTTLVADRSPILAVLVPLGLIALTATVLLLSPLALPAIGQIDPNISLVALFSLGLVTSLHCVGMCGGINLAVSIGSNQRTTLLDKKPIPWLNSALYNGGRVVSYTVIGGALGAFGGLLAITMPLKIAIALIAGLLMFLLGLKQVGFKVPFKVTSILPSSLYSKLSKGFGNFKPLEMGPFAVGLVNGFMPCGPLAAMQLYAIGSGSWLAGASGLFFFSLGTSPLMFAFGSSAGFMGKNLTKRISQLSGVLLMVLAVIAIERGLVLANIKPMGLIAPTQNQDVATTESPLLDMGLVATLKDGYQEVVVEVTRSGYGDVVVQVGVPVRLIFNASQNSLTSCNEAISIPDFNIQKGLIPGETIVEFTPTAVGELPYSCWMGMINNTIYVVDKISD